LDKDSSNDSNSDSIGDVPRTIDFECSEVAERLEPDAAETCRILVVTCTTCRRDGRSLIACQIFPRRSLTETCTAFLVHGDGEMARWRDRETRHAPQNGRIHLRVIVSPIPVIRLSPIDRQRPMRRPRKSWQGFIAPVDRAYNGLNDLDFIPGLEPRTANNRSRANPRARRETAREGTRRRRRTAARYSRRIDRACERS